MTPQESAARALFAIEHPHVDLSVWDLLDADTRAWWTERARPIHDAVREAAS